jgi:hypothetical protein
VIADISITVYNTMEHNFAPLQNDLLIRTAKGKVSTQYIFYSSLIVGLIRRES